MREQSMHGVQRDLRVGDKVLHDDLVGAALCDHLVEGCLDLLGLIPTIARGAPVPNGWIRNFPDTCAVPRRCLRIDKTCKE